MAEPRTALELALRALHNRGRSGAELDRRLCERGVEEDERRAALESLARAGYLDDERFALDRARSLAERWAGDELIRADLAGRGVSAETVERAVEALEPEQVRAQRVVGRRGSGPRTFRYLVARGFNEDVVGALVARETGEAIG